MDSETHVTVHKCFDGLREKRSSFFSKRASKAIELHGESEVRIPNAFEKK